MHSQRRLLLTTVICGLAIAAAGCGSSSKTTTTTTHPASTTPATAAKTTTAPASTSTGGGLSGKWSGQYSGAFSGTFTLNWHQSGSKLSGGIALSAPPDTLSIHGSVNGTAIRFGTVGSVAITYSGSVSGNSMSGSYQTPKGGGPWSATKS